MLFLCLVHVHEKKRGISCSVEESISTLFKCIYFQIKLHVEMTFLSFLKKTFKDFLSC